MNYLHASLKGEDPQFLLHRCRAIIGAGVELSEPELGYWTIDAGRKPVLRFRVNGGYRETAEPLKAAGIHCTFSNIKIPELFVPFPGRDQPDWD